MNKLAETLISKHLDKKIELLCNEIFEESFENIFKSYCLNKKLVGNDTTIGITLRTLESIAKEIIINKLMQQEEKSIFDECNISTNPFFNLYYDLINQFKEYLIWGIHDSIEYFISELVREKSIELKDKKIIDEHGDYLN